MTTMISKRLLHTLFFGLALDVITTTLFFVVQVNNTAELHRTQVNLRAAQIATCVADNQRAQAIRIKETALLAQQVEGLAQLKNIPVLNTDAINKIARKNLEDTIAIRQAELAAFPITPCPIK